MYQATIDNPGVLRVALSEKFTLPIIMDPWVLPAGAYGESAGPT